MYQPGPTAVVQSRINWYTPGLVFIQQQYVVLVEPLLRSGYINDHGPRKLVPGIVLIADRGPRVVAKRHRVPPPSSRGVSGKGQDGAGGSFIGVDSGEGTYYPGALGKYEYLISTREHFRQGAT